METIKPLVATQLLLQMHATPDILQVVHKHWLACHNMN